MLQPNSFLFYGIGHAVKPLCVTLLLCVLCVEKASSVFFQHRDAEIGSFTEDNLNLIAQRVL